MLDVVVLGSESLVVGFRLAGVSRGYIVTKEDINQVFENLVKMEDIGIIIMDNNDFIHLNERNKEKAMTLVKPTVVVLSFDTSGEENLRLMIKRSIGVDLWDKQ